MLTEHWIDTGFSVFDGSVYSRYDLFIYYKYIIVSPAFLFFHTAFTHYALHVFYIRVVIFIIFLIYDNTYIVYL